MRDSLKVISSVLHQTFLEHGQEFVSKAILKGPETAIKELGQAGVGNVVDNMREVRKAIEELQEINNQTDNQDGKTAQKMENAKNVISRLPIFVRRLLDALVPPELQYLITQSK